MCFDTLLKGNKFSISDITSHESNEITGEYGCEFDVNCITQPLESNDIVLLKLPTKLTTKYFVGLIQEMKIYGYNTRYFRKRLICFIFYFLQVKDGGVRDRVDIYLNYHFQWFHEAVAEFSLRFLA